MRRALLQSAAVALALTAGPGLCQFADTPAHVIGNIPAPYAVAAGDLNNDGLPDLLVSSWFRLPGPGEAYDDTKSRVLLYFQKEGEFAAPADRQLVVKNPLGLAVGDFDNDGANDLAVGPYGSLHLYLGSEELAQDHSCADINGPIGDPRPCKLNRTGLTDFLSGPVWIKWLGGDQFQHGYFYGPDVNDNRGSIPADFNHDGETDVLLMSRDGRSLRIYYGPLVSMSVRPGDLFLSATLLSPQQVSEMAVGDLNDDGRLDVVTASSFSPIPAERNILLYYQNSPLHFTENAGPSATISELCGRLVVADLNADGLDDLVVAEAGADRVFVFLQKKGRPIGMSAKDADQVLTVGNNHALTLANLNRDGLPDLVHSDGRSTIRVHFNVARRKPE